MVLRAYDDGVAYRFTTEIGGKIKVVNEEASVTFPTPDLTSFVS